MVTKDQAFSGKGPDKGPVKRPESAKKAETIERRIESVYAIIIDNPSISRAEISRKLALSDKQIRVAIEILKSRGKYTEKVLLDMVNGLSMKLNDIAINQHT